MTSDFTIVRRRPLLRAAGRLVLLGTCLAAGPGGVLRGLDTAGNAAASPSLARAETKERTRGLHAAGNAAASPSLEASFAALRPVQDDAPAAGGVYTAAQAERGRAVYREHCASCHGSSLRGGANEFAAPALAGPFFFDAWSGRTVGELLRYSADNMPPEGMLLPAADYVDVTAYVLQVLGYPEGDADLTAASPALERAIERQR